MNVSVHIKHKSDESSLQSPPSSPCSEAVYKINKRISQQNQYKNTQKLLGITSASDLESGNRLLDSIIYVMQEVLLCQ